MACADIPMVIMGTGQQDDDEGDHSVPVIKYYKAIEQLPSAEGPLHDLLQKQPAVLGSLQMVSGLLSFGLGVVFATTQDPTRSFLTLFRVSLLTGLLFFIAGLLSNLLFKSPRLVPVCLFVNIGSIIVAVVGGVLICVDLSSWRPIWHPQDNLNMEALVLGVLVMEVIISAVLSSWFRAEMCSHSL